jgi:hypothetical protein
VDLRQIGRGGTEWIDLIQDRDQYRAFVNTVMKHRTPENVEKYLSKDKKDKI